MRGAGYLVGFVQEVGGDPSDAGGMTTPIRIICTFVADSAHLYRIWISPDTVVAPAVLVEMEPIVGGLVRLSSAGATVADGAAELDGQSSRWIGCLPRRAGIFSTIATSRATRRSRETWLGERALQAHRAVAIQDGEDQIGAEHRITAMTDVRLDRAVA